MFLMPFGVVLSNGRENEAGQSILEQGQFESILAPMPRLRHLMIAALGMTVGHRHHIEAQAITQLRLDKFSSPTFMRGEYIYNKIDESTQEAFISARGFFPSSPGGRTA